MTQLTKVKQIGIISLIIGLHINTVINTDRSFAENSFDRVLLGAGRQQHPNERRISDGGRQVERSSLLGVADSHVGAAGDEEIDDARV